MKKFFNNTIFRLITCFLLASAALCLASKILSNFEIETPIQKLIVFGYACLLNFAVLVIAICVGVFLEIRKKK